MSAARPPKKPEGKSMKPPSVRLAAISASLAIGVLAGQGAAQNPPTSAQTAAQRAGAPPAEAAHGTTPPPAPAPAAAPPPAPQPAYQAVRATDPAAVERGRALYVANFGCSSCHAADLRGGTGGNSLLRSRAMMMDANGELIARATRETWAHGGRFAAITDAQYRDIAQYMKSFPNIGVTQAVVTPAVYQSGDPEAGRRYFAANCASCHAVERGAQSPAANLAGIGAGVPVAGLEARNLQQRWLNPSTTKPTTAVVTLANGQRLEGRATRFDEFALNLTLADGSTRTIERDGDNPRIEMTYPLAGHAALLRRMTDRNIHEVTGYLVTLK